MRVSTCFAIPCFFLAGALLSGCSTDFGHSADSPTPVTAQFKGVIRGGQQPIVGSQVFLFAANPGGYGQPSINLLTAGDGSDPNYGNYFLTDASGSFNLNGAFTCPAGDPVTYMLATQGNPGLSAGTNNPAISLIAALGRCSSLGSIPFVSINEVTTVAAAYAFSGYMTDFTHLGSSGTALALTGLANAAANAGNLANLATGQAYATTPGSSSSGVTGTVPAATLNTLANILASCVNTSGSTASGDPCGTLFSLATSDGTATGTMPTETATAMLNLAHYPVTSTANIAALYVLNTSIAPFNPSLTVAPSNWVVGINYSGGVGASGYEPQAVAIDAAGNAWVVNSAGNSVTEITTPGASANSFSYSGGHISRPTSIAIDSAGNAWVANGSGNTVTEIMGSGAGASYFTSYGGGGPLTPYGFGGTPLSLSIDGMDNVWVVGGNVTEITGSGAGASYAFYTAGGLSAPEGIAIDDAGNVWVTNNLGGLGSSVTEITVSGTTPSYSHYSNIGSYPIGIAIDAANNVWIPDQVNNSVMEITGSGPGSGRTTYSGGGPNWHPIGPAIDGAGNVWVADLGNSVSEITGSGASASYIFYSFGGISNANSVAIDGSGDVWTANANSTVTELMGVATPVVTPITAGSKTVPGKLGVRP